MNKTAREKLKNPVNVEIAYDSINNMIRIKPNEEGLTIKKTKIFSKGIYKHFGITAFGKFNALYIEDDNALYIDLKQRPA